MVHNPCDDNNKMDIIGNDDVTGINRLRAIVTDFTE
jgi:hypothetical protein